MNCNASVEPPERALSVLYPPIFMRSLPFALLGFLLPIVGKKMDADALTIGGLFAVVPLTMLLLRPIVGWAVDAYGRRYFIIAALIGTALSMLLFAALASIEVLYAARVVQAIAGAFMGIATQTMVADVATPDERGTQMGRIGEMTARGQLAGILAGLFVFHQFADFEDGWRAVFMCYAVVAILGAGFAWRKVPETRPTVPDADHRIQGATLYALFAGVSLPLVKLMVIVFTTTMSASMLAPIFLVFLQDRITTDVALLGWAFIPGAIAYSVLPSRLGKLSDRFGRSPLMVVGLIGSGLFSIVMPSLSSLIWLAGFNVLLTVGRAMADPAQAAMVADLTEGQSRGRAYGWYLFAVSLGGIFGPLVGGWLYEQGGPAVPFYLNGAVLLVSASWAWIVLRPIPGQELA